MTTLRDIADKTGFSVRTVSRALHSNGYASPETRKRVLAAARDAGYHMNPAARALKTGKAQMGSVDISTTDEMYMLAVRGLQERLSEEDYQVQIAFKPKQDIGALLAARPSGVAFLPRWADFPVEKAYGSIEAQGTPCVVVAMEHPTTLDHVAVDRAQGVYEAVRYLAGCGHRRIAYVGMADNSLPDRQWGYQRAIMDLGFEPIICLGDASIEDIYTWGYSAAKAFLAIEPRPDAVQVFSDVVALGFLGSMHGHGVWVPEDVAVVGFDGRSFARATMPPLTTVELPMCEVGRTAAEILLSKMRGEDRPPGGWVHSLTPRLTVRAST